MRLMVEAEDFDAVIPVYKLEPLCALGFSNH